MRFYDERKMSMEYKIGSFNCLNLGQVSVNKKDKDMITRIILESRFDIVALQEVKDTVVVNTILYTLNCGRSSSGIWKGAADNEVNDYAFIWNSSRVELASTKLKDGSIRMFQPRIYKQYRLDRKKGELPLIREPFYARFHTVVPGLPKIEFRLINTHIRYSKGKDGENAIVPLGETAMRQNEFLVLGNSIYNRISDRCYGSNDGYGSAETAYTILLGDYNLNLRSANAGSPYLPCEEFIIDTRKQKCLRTVQTGLTTLKKPSKKEDSHSEEIGDYYVSNYDHFTYDSERFDGTTVTCERIDAVKEYCDDDYEKYVEKVSDHVPIRMTFDLKKG